MNEKIKFNKDEIFTGNELNGHTIIENIKAKIRDLNDKDKLLYLNEVKYCIKNFFRHPELITKESDLYRDYNHLSKSLIKSNQNRFNALNEVENWLLMEIEKLSKSKIKENIKTLRIKEDKIVNTYELYKYLIKENIVPKRTTYCQLLLCFMNVPINYIKTPVVWRTSDIQLIRLITDLTFSGVVIRNNYINRSIKMCFHSERTGQPLKYVTQTVNRYLKGKPAELRSEEECRQLSDMLIIMNK
jgi:hypothetical protein